MRLIQGVTFCSEPLVWTISNDIHIGTGTHVVAMLPFGTQMIIFTATDSPGNQISTNMEIWVGFDVYLPSVMRNG